MAAFQTPRGSNPLLQTKRGKLQQRRSTLNEQISKQLRLRAGAENLLRATNDKKLREQITLELSFVDSNLQLLSEELAELNTSVQIYQNEKCPRSMPLIPFGLRETKDVEFATAFKEFIGEHYSEDSDKYDHAVRMFAELRNAIKTPSRNDDGVKLLFEYYNQLCCVERRFFIPGKHSGVYFEWFDSVTGIPAMQRSVAFEKGSVLFNIGALYTQLAASEDRATVSGLEKAVEYFSRAAGILHYLKENFSNSPSVDMRRDVLDVLLSLLLAQVQECFFDLCLLRMDKKQSTSHRSMKLAEEASQVSKLYSDACRVTSVQTIKQYLPAPWLILLTVKRDHYMALGHFFEAVALVATSDPISDCDSDKPSSSPKSRGAKDEDHSTGGSSGDHSSQTVAEKALLARVHLKNASALHEEAINEARMSKQLRQLTILQNVLQKSQERTQKLKQELDGGTGGIGADDLELEIYETAEVVAQSVFDPTLMPPEFSAFKVVDMFRDLGPLSAFSARSKWTPARTLHMRRTPRSPGYGFSVRGDAPVFISCVETGGLAFNFGLQVGDIIVAINGCDTKWASHEDLVCLIRAAGDSLSLSVVSPAPLASPVASSMHSLSPSSTSSCSSAAASPAHSNHAADTSHGAVSTPGSYSTLPSNFQNRSKLGQQKKALQASNPQLNQSTGIFSFTSLKNLKQKRKSNGHTTNGGCSSCSSSNGSHEETNNGSRSLRSLLFSKKYSKSVDANLNSLHYVH